MTSLTSSCFKTRGFLYFSILSLTGILLLSACKEEIVPEIFHPRNDHEAYEHSLKKAGLHASALGTDWIREAREALARPVPVEMPLNERIYVDDREATAVGYRFSVKRGQRVEASVEVHSTSPLKLFIDVFRVRDGNDLRHVATADSDNYEIEFEPRSDGEYVLRVQPELLRGGEVNVSIRRSPAIGMPVSEAKMRDIGSFFGDPRDGGRRKHHGIDIFAPKRTPIIAPVAGRVRFTGERGLGGLVVWLRDHKRDMSLYFAHLDEIRTSKGEWVEPGDTIGTVGNTGNARRTPPHLHFGIYQDGPIDPYYFVAEADKIPGALPDESGLLGRAVRVKSATKIDVGQGSGTLNLERHQLAYVVGISDSRHRVALPDGRTGYINPRDLEEIDRPIKQYTASSSTLLMSEPHTEAPMISRIESGDDAIVLALNDKYALVDSGAGRGWILANP